jgi:hypothetical protein
MNADNDSWHFLFDRLKWIGLYFGIGFILISILRSPYDLISIIVLFIIINVWRGRKLMKRYGGISGIRDLLSTISANNDRPLRYYCMSCGKEHRETACPNCGSRTKSVG